MAIPLSTLRQRVYDLMDEGQSGTNSSGPPYVTAAQVADQLNNAVAQLWSIYLDKDARYVETDYVFTPTINTRDYALPANFRQLIKAYTLPVPGASASLSAHVPLQRTMPDRYMGVPAYYGWFYPSGAWLPTYDILGSSLRLDPTPTVTPPFQIALWYQAHYTPMVADTDTLDPIIFPGHEQYLVLQAAIMLRMGKEEQPADDLVAERNRISQMIERDLVVRDYGTGKRIVEVDDYPRWWAR